MKYVLSLSYGKDSMALLLEVIRRKLPLDYVIHCDIMFDKKTSGEHPLMAEWIPKAEKRLKEEFGIEIIHLTGRRNFVEQFYTIKQRGKHIGDNYGFPYISKQAWCCSSLKLNPISQYIRKLTKQGNVVTEYVGIASDEKERLERYKELETDNHKYITLADLGITEDEAMQICKDNNLLSPKYEKSFRGGCWFCPKQSMPDLYNLWKEYPDLFERLVEMEKDSFNTFKPNNPLKDIKKKFENGKVYRIKPKQLKMF